MYELNLISQIMVCGWVCIYIFLKSVFERMGKFHYFLTPNDCYSMYVPDVIDLQS